MKIGIEAQRLFRTRKHGMDIVILEQLRELQRMDTGHRFVVYVKPGPDVCLESTDSMEIRELNAPSYPLWEQVALPRAASADGVDLLHCTSNTAPINSVVPVVLTLHDIIFLESRPKLGEGRTLYQTLGNHYRRWNVPRVLNSAHRVITVSEYERRRIARHFSMGGTRLRVVYNGVSRAFNIAPTLQAVEQFKAEHALPDRFFLFLGNTDPKKNLRNVVLGYLDHASKTQDPNPLVIADLDVSVLERLVPEAKAALSDRRIQVTGYVAHRDMPLLYAAADTFLYPSLRESFGLPILEAMSAGTPVITANTASMPEVAGDAGVLVDPTLPEHIGSMLSFLQSNERV